MLFTKTRNIIGELLISDHQQYLLSTAFLQVFAFMQADEEQAASSESDPESDEEPEPVHEKPPTKQQKKTTEAEARTKTKASTSKGDWGFLTLETVEQWCRDAKEFHSIAALEKLIKVH